LKDRIVPFLALRKMTQAQFAEELGMSAKHLPEILNGKSGQNLKKFNQDSTYIGGFYWLSHG
jgi:transcriptional regulator with XRE-family HTH domain